MQKLIILISFAAIIFFGSCRRVSPKTGKNAEILGSWDLKETHFIMPDTTHKNVPSQKGLLLFTATHYSFMWITTKSPRKAFQILAKPTDEEAIAGFKGIAFNAGTYQYSDNILETKAEIAKVPGFEGGKQIYELKIVGKQLIMTMKDEIYPNGTKPDWVGKMSVRLIWERAE
jgi:hypothetical protein